MESKIFVNLPVSDLKRAVEFFAKLGYTFNQQFTDETATCMVISDTIFVMLLVESRFKDFTKKPVSDARRQTEVLISIQVESKTKVEEIVNRAVDAGGEIYADPQDHGWMYLRSFADLDGHQWEIFFMDESQIPKK